MSQLVLVPEQSSSERTTARTNGRTAGTTDGRTDGRTDERTEIQTKERRNGTNRTDRQMVDGRKKERP